MKRVILFTDGSCLGNPGPGGRACVMRCGSVGDEVSGMDAHTANNRMELPAVIAGLSASKEPCSVRVVTDCQ
jgi:ribonuclease HI